MNERFDVRLDPDALKEYEAIDNSVIDIVDKALEMLLYRADEIGKPLGNKRDMKLAGCKEIKLRDAGIRIVFRVKNKVVQVLRVVYILALERRSSDFVFKLASKRYKKFTVSKQQLDILLEKGTSWKKKS